MHEELHLSQDAIAAAEGKDRATVANFIGLLKLPAEIRNDLSAGALMMGHARALLSLADETAQRRVARDVVSRGLSVRETEAVVRREIAPPATVPADAPANDANTRAAEEKLRVALGTRVRITRRGKGGRIEIDFTNEDELNRIYEALTGE